jgi:hypothetical protein
MEIRILHILIISGDLATARRPQLVLGFLDGWDARR